MDAMADPRCPLAFVGLCGCGRLRAKGYSYQREQTTRRQNCGDFGRRFVVHWPSPLTFPAAAPDRAQASTALRLAISYEAEAEIVTALPAYACPV
jgi:hypothetical protein